MRNREEHRNLAVIMFTDLVGYSALTQRNEPLAPALLYAHQQSRRPIKAQYGGRETKSTGDGFLLELMGATGHVERLMKELEAN